MDKHFSLKVFLKRNFLAPHVKSSQDWMTVHLSGEVHVAQSSVSSTKEHLPQYLDFSTFDFWLVVKHIVCKVTTPLKALRDGTMSSCLLKV